LGGINGRKRRDVFLYVPQTLTAPEQANPLKKDTLRLSS
jgi:hypothetical protein